MREQQIQSDTIPPVYFSCLTTVPLIWKFVPSKIYSQPQSYCSEKQKTYNSEYTRTTCILVEIFSKVKQ